MLTPGVNYAAIANSPSTNAKASSIVQVESSTFAFIVSYDIKEDTCTSTCVIILTLKSIPKRAQF